MKVQVLVCALLCVVAFAAASDVEEESTEVEMAEVASFVETAADLGQLQEIGTESTEQLDANGFPVPLTKKQRRTTMEPQYWGEPLGRKKYIVPEYAVPKVPKIPRRHRKNKPRVFSSHYFSPMPKPKKGGPSCKAGDKKCRRRWKRAAARRRRRNSPLKSVETYNHHLVKNKGFVNPEIIANYPGGPRGDHLAKKAEKRGGKPFGLPKKTLAPAPVIKFLEISSQEAQEAVDTSAEAEEQGVDEEAEFSEQELDGREQVTVLNGPEQFFEEGFQAPDWADEELAEEENIADESAAEEESEEGEAAEEESEDEDSSEADSDEVALIQENDEDEESDESEDEDEEADEGEDEEEADEESEDESEEDTEEVSLIEASAEAEDEDEDEADEEDEEEDESNESQEEAVDELAENEEVAEQIDMDASDDDADQDEDMDEEAEEESDDEAQDNEEAETEANEEAVAEMFEVDNHLNDADTLLAEVDAHLTTHADNEAEAETEMVKGTPGSSVDAGQTWEDAQNEKLDALEAHLAAERAATPKFAAKVVAPTDLAAVDAEHQLPEFDQDESDHDAVETVAPEYAAEF